MDDLPDLIYIADPMCSWCWGFAPVMAALRARYAGQLRFNLLMGGLNPAPGRPLDAATQAGIEHHWQQVHAASGQPFNERFFTRTGFVYDTEPASRAVVCARRLRPGSELDLLPALQEAFYVHDRDITDAGVLCDIAVGHGFDAGTFAGAFADHKTWLATGNDFSIARSMGVSGFPAVAVASDGQGLAVLSQGYQPLVAVAAIIDEWLAIA